MNLSGWIMALTIIPKIPKKFQNSKDSLKKKLSSDQLLVYTWTASQYDGMWIGYNY